MIKRLFTWLLVHGTACYLCRGEWTDRGSGMWMAFWKHKDWCPLKTHKVLPDGSREYDR